MPRSKSSRRRLRAEREREHRRGEAPVAVSMVKERPASGRKPAAVRARPAGADTVAGAQAPPERWPLRAMFVQVALMGVVLLIGGWWVARNNPEHYPALFVALAWEQPSLTIAGLLSGAIAAPFAKRLGGAPRPLRFTEAIAMGALLVMVQSLIQYPFIPEIRQAGTTQELVRRITDGTELRLALADITALVVLALVFPHVSRLLFNPRRRRPPRPPRAPRTARP